MKKLIVLVAMSLTATAYAGPPKSQNSAGFLQQGQVQGQYQNQNQSQSVLNNNPLNIGGDRISNPLQIPMTPPAIAPAQSVNNDCQIATPKANAWSAVLVSVSYTDGVEYNDLCYAYKRNQFDVADRLMCAKSADYKAANPSVCGK